MMGEIEPGKAVMRSHVAALSPKLKQLEPTQDVAAHSGLVQHLQFLPDGRYLATLRYMRRLHSCTLFLDILL